MRRLLRVILLLPTVLVITASAARAVGSRQPAGILLSTLRLTDCASPCWIGIVPGKTTIEEARARMAAVYGSQPDQYVLSFDGGMPRGLLWASLDNVRQSLGVIWITIDAQSDDVIDVIRFDFNSIYIEKQPTLGEFHSLFGAPSRTVFSAGAVGAASATMAMAYGDDFQGTLLFTMWYPRLHWTQPVRTLVLYGAGQLPLARSTELKTWRGFTTVR